MPPEAILADAAGLPAGESSQARYHRRWDHLQDRHVRALAWLLDAPDLLDPAAPQWGGRIASLATGLGDAACHTPAGPAGAWLRGLDADPQALHAYLGEPAMTRLGRYAEKLLAFYFSWCGTLVAHGLQVRAAKNDTIGEFDFLLRDGATLLHLELATKFYLFEAAGDIAASDGGQDFIGPNLADTLGAKMDKILNRQLALAQHPAAQACLPPSLQVASAQALIKGWLFYHASAAEPGQTLPTPARGSPGVSAAHCRGTWCSLTEFDTVGGAGFLLLARLAWLAPARSSDEAVNGHAAMRERLALHFKADTMPVLVASMERYAGVWRETGRCFVVPDDWRDRVHERNQRTVLRLGPENGLSVTARRSAPANHDRAD